MFTISDSQQEKRSVYGEICARARYQWKPGQPQQKHERWDPDQLIIV